MLVLYKPVLLISIFVFASWLVILEEFDNLKRSNCSQHDFCELSAEQLLRCLNRTSWCGQKCLLALSCKAIRSLILKARALVVSDLDLDIIKGKLAEAIIHAISTGRFRLPKTLAIAHRPSGIPAQKDSDFHSVAASSERLSDAIRQTAMIEAHVRQT